MRGRVTCDIRYEFWRATPHSCCRRCGEAWAGLVAPAQLQVNWSTWVGAGHLLGTDSCPWCKPHIQQVRRGSWGWWWRRLGSLQGAGSHHCLWERLAGSSPCLPCQAVFLLVIWLHAWLGYLSTSHRSLHLCVFAYFWWLWWGGWADTVSCQSAEIKITNLIPEHDGPTVGVLQSILWWLLCDPILAIC